MTSFLLRLRLHYKAAHAGSVEAVEKNQPDQILIGSRKQTRSRVVGIPRFKQYNYDQDAMVVINYQEQLQPGVEPGSN